MASRIFEPKHYKLEEVIVEEAEHYIISYIDYTDDKIMLDRYRSEEEYINDQQSE